MKRAVFLLLSLAAASFAQQAQTPPAVQAPTGLGGDRAVAEKLPYTTAEVTARRVPVTHSDLYCAGFIGEPVSRVQFVEGGRDTPHATRFSEGDLIYLRGGSYQPGTRVSIIREARSPDRVELFSGQHRILSKLGALYMDMGYADVLEIRGTDTAVARIEFSCDPITTGDLIVPFTARQMVTSAGEARMDRYAVEPSGLTARIVQSKDFDYLVASGRKVYLDVGADKGVKAGDHFRIVRDYRPESMDRAEAISYKAKSMEDTQHTPPALPRSELKNLPRHIVGELLVLAAYPKSSTAMLTFALDAVHLGDMAELEPGGTAAPAGEQK